MFCKYCGKELTEHAVVCPGCGCLASDSAPTEHAVVPPVPAPLPVLDREGERIARLKSAEKKAKLFSILGFIFLCVEFFFLFMQIADILECVMGYYSYYDTSAAVIAWLFSWAALAMGITAFVCSSKIRRTNLALRTITVFVFTASIVTFIIPMAFM